jgi:hypothetical protein
MGLFDDLGNSTGGGPPVPPKRDPASALRRLNEPTWERMEHAYKYGVTKGETCHIKELDPHFKWMPGYLNVWTGWMNEGKTEWIYQLLLLRAVLADKKSAIFSPENMPEEQIYDQLIHSLTGQNPDRDWQNCLPMARYKMARDFVREYFIVVYPEREMGRTPHDLLRYFEAAAVKHNITHCFVDPWTKLDNSAMASMGGDAPYLGHVLSELSDWTTDTKLSLTITAHPRQLPDMKHGQPRPIPDSSHVAGGQAWENIPHIAATYYRPWKHLGSANSLYSDVAIYVKKVKSRKLVGHAGSIGDGSENPDVRITYDWRTARYYINGVSPLDCRTAEELYLTDEDLRTRDDQRRDTTPAAAKQPATEAPPAPLNTANPNESEANPNSMDDELPPDWHPGGRPITLPPAPDENS